MWEARMRDERRWPSHQQFFGRQYADQRQHQNGKRVHAPRLFQVTVQQAVNGAQRARSPNNEIRSTDAPGTAG